MAKLDSIASESLQRVNNNNGHWKPVVHPRTPVTINDENITPQRSNAKDGSQRHQVDDKNTVQAIIPRKRPLHAISTNECFIISKRASWIKKEVFRSINANVNDTCLPNTRLDEQNDPIVAVKKEEDLDSHTIDLSLPSDSAHIDDFTLKNETINDQSIKKNDNKSNTATSSRDDSRSIGQGPITPSSSGTIINNHQQSINRLPVSAGHQHHRAHMTGETCIACANVSYHC
jgi:hypothetical protein